MMDWKITQSITNGINNGIEKGITNATDKITGFFKNMIFDSIDILLDAGATFIIIMLFWCCFRIIIIKNSEKREENATMIVSLFGLYFIVRMLSKMTG